MAPKTAANLVAMSLNAIGRRVVNLYPGQAVTVRFKKRSKPTATVCILGFAEAGMISAETSQLSLIERIVETGDWGGDDNRVVEFRTLHDFDINWFWPRVREEIDYIAVE